MIEKILELGDRNFLTSDNIFCFGDRQTKKTWNMLLKGFLRCHEHLEKHTDQKEYRMIIVSATLSQGINSLSIGKQIAKKLGLFIEEETQQRVVIKLCFGRKFIIELVHIADQTRGKFTDFIMWDEPEFHPNKKGFFGSLLLNKTDFVMGGSSFYPMGINPKLEHANLW